MSNDLGVNDSGHYEACLLRSVNGSFRSNNTTNDGVWTGINGSNHWIINTAANKGAAVDCVY